MVGGERDGERVTAAGQLSRGGQPRLGRRGHPVEPQPQLALAEQLRERPGGGDAALVEDDDPVADAFHLTDEVGVEQHGDLAFLE
jgi:hypothetical protein